MAYFGKVAKIVIDNNGPRSVIADVQE